MITITQQAATALTMTRAGAGVPDSYGVRLYSQDAGGQPRLALSFAARPAPGDQVAEQAGIKTFIAREVADTLGNATLDARRWEGDEQFIIRRDQGSQGS